MKVVTTWSALEYLGPAYTWPTEVYFLGDFDGRKLDGDLALKGYGDPYLVVEEVWKLLRALRRTGLEEIERRSRARRQLFRRRRAGARRVRRPAVSHLQRRAERAADELQGRAVPVQAGSRSTAASNVATDPVLDEPQDRQQPRRSSTGRAAAIRPASRSIMREPRVARARRARRASSRAAATSTAWAARCCSTTRSRSGCSRRCGRKSAGRSPASSRRTRSRRRRRRRSSGNRSRSARSSAASTRTATTS